MGPAIDPQRFSAFENMSLQDVQALLSGARVESTVPGSALMNRHVAVLCKPTLQASGDALAAAASALGATVVRLSSDTLRLDDRQCLRETARLLGRLYCLICSEGLGLAVNSGLSRWAGVPVLNDVTLPAHPTRILADLMSMQDHARRPAATITLGLSDDPDARTFRAWQLASGLTGLRVVRIDAALASSAAPECDFFFGPGPQCAACRVPHLIAVDAVAGACTCLAAQQADARLRLLRSLLLQVCS